MKKRLIILSTLLLTSSAGAVPLTRYFPDFPLGAIEAKDLQETLAQTGSFGDDTKKLLAIVLKTSMSSGDNQQAGLLQDLTVNSMLGSIKDIAAAAYTVKNTPEYLVAIRLTAKNPITTAFINVFNEAIKNSPKRIREGNYTASNDGIAAGIGNNIFYLSSNADLLRAYLRRLNGQPLPVMTNNANYRSILEGTGDGFLKQYFNFTSIAQLLGRDKSIPLRMVNALRTLNVNASSSSVIADGMETKSLTQLNANSDATLYKLLTYTPEKLELLNQLPSTAPSASVFATDTSGWLDYFGAWLPDIGYDKTSQKDILTAFSRLKERLGNEWAVISDTAPNANVLTSALFGTGAVTPFSGILGGLGSILSPTNTTVYYGQTKDGAQTLTDLETAMQTEIKNNVQSMDSDVKSTITLERIIIAGYDALQIKQSVTVGKNKPVEGSLLIIAKDNTIVIGSNADQLEGYLIEAPLMENPAFKAIAFPTKIVGLQYTSPVRLARADIEQSVKAYIELLQPDKKTAATLLPAVTDWLESWSARTEVGYGYSVADANKLLGYNKTGFMWNR